MRSLKAYDNVTFLLSVIDVLSKYAWVEPMKDKTNTSVIAAFRRIIERCNNRSPTQLQTHKGT